MRRPMLAALFSLAALPAVAQDRPPICPTRDVSITYRFTGPQAQQAPTMTMSWMAASQTMRMDMGAMGYMVADYRNQRGFMVMPQARMIMDVPIEQAMQQYGPTETGTYRRTGTASVAGHQCTIWSFEDRGSNGTACITAEGVMLRAQGTNQGHSGSMEATQVAFGTQDPSRFQRPQGYQSVQVPGGGAMPGGRPPAK